MVVYVQRAQFSQVDIRLEVAYDPSHVGAQAWIVHIERLHAVHIRATGVSVGNVCLNPSILG
jgi:hypothetical protein